MKNRIIYVTAGVLVLSAGIYFSTRLWAQQPTAPQPSAQTRAQTRVGVINMGFVIKGYTKVAAYEAEIKGQVTNFEASTKQQRDWITSAKTYIADPKNPQPEREKQQDQLKLQERDFEDKAGKFQKTMTEKQGQMMVTIYSEIREAASRYALSMNLDMVLTYLDVPSDSVDYLAPRNVMAKMQQPALMPLYYNNSMDVSRDVLQALNAGYRPAGGGPVAPAAPAAQH